MAEQIEQTVMPEATPPQPSQPKSNKIGMVLFFLLFIILAALGGYAYIIGNKANKHILTTLHEIQAQSKINHDDITALQQSMRNIDQITATAQDLVAKQSQMMADWQAAQKGDLEKWYVAEAQYFVKLANDHMQFSRDANMSLVLLQRANQVLENLNSDKLLEIKKSLANDITTLQANPQMDLTSVYVKLNALNAQLDSLPLPSTPLPETDAAGKVDTTGLPWWKAGLQRSWAALKQIVVVRNTSNILPLVLPDEKIFIYQNLHAQFENALWGILHRNQVVYNASLDRALTWTQQYFVQDAPQTKAVLAGLQALRQIEVAAPKADYTETLKLFDAYLSSNPDNAKGAAN